MPPKNFSAPERHAFAATVGALSAVLGNATASVTALAVAGGLAVLLVRAARGRP